MTSHRASNGKHRNCATSGLRLTVSDGSVGRETTRLPGMRGPESHQPHEAVTHGADDAKGRRGARNSGASDDREAARHSEAP
jgi:hypothetical protein